jgi:hypothetical protein
MNYKSKDKDDKVIFQCECGEYSFMMFDVVDWADDGNISYILTLIDCPITFWQKLTYLFKREVGIHDILLTKDDVKEFKKVLSKV